MSDYLLAHGTRATPQSEPLPGQVPNSAGGNAWQINDLGRLRRFLILGTEGGSYYASERGLTKPNVEVVKRMAVNDGAALVAEVIAISESGRAPKNDPALYALAAAISLGDNHTRSLAAEALPRVARIGTHLYHFVAYAETMRGWGRTLRWAVGNWYEQKPELVALQGVKYRQRDGWSHRDLLRLAHPKPDGEGQAALWSWLAGKEIDFSRLPELVKAFEEAQASTSPAETARLVREARLPREALLTEHLNDPEVWRALIEAGMPMTALTRNLATMTRVGVLTGDHKATVVAALGNQDAIRKSRLHPLALLVALRTYASGHGFRGGNEWRPIPQITDALDEAFYLAFDNVEPSGKTQVLALDVSGSMGMGQVAGSPLSPREASAALALVTLHTEPDVEVIGFSHQLISLPLSRRQRLDDAVRSISGIPFGGTDCALPMLAQYDVPIDGFTVLTDSETWFGQIHPKQALDRYRQLHGRNSRLAVVGMVANQFSIADPNDPGMLDVVGFDTAAPALVADFIAGRL